MRYHCYAMGKVKVCVCTACVCVYSMCVCVCVCVCVQCVCVCVCVCVCIVCVYVCVCVCVCTVCVCVYCVPRTFLPDAAILVLFSIIASGNGKVQCSSMCVCKVMHTLSCVVELARQSDRHGHEVSVMSMVLELRTVRIFWRQRRTLNTQNSPKRMAYIPMTKMTVIIK